MLPPLPANAQWNVLNTGNHTYFSRLDSAIWFGTGVDAIYLSHAVSLEYSVQEMVMPMFAYGDYTMRRAAHGMRIVHGAVSVLYQQTLLMYEILERMGGVSVEERILAPITQDHIPDLGTTLAGSTALPAIVGSLLPSQTRSLLANLSTQVKTKSGLENFAEAKSHQEALAKAKNVVTAKTKTSTAKTAPGVLARMQSRLTPYYSRYETQPEGFEITIDFGKNPSGPTALEVPGAYALPLSYAQATDKVGEAFAEPAKDSLAVQRALIQAPAWTTRKILGVHLTGMQTVLDDSGRPLFEVYSFLASDLV